MENTAAAHHFAHTRLSRRRRPTAAHSAALTSPLIAHTRMPEIQNTSLASFAVRIRGPLVLLRLTVLPLVHREQIWRTKWTPKIRKRHPAGRQSVRVQVIVSGLGVFASSRPAADQRTRFSMTFQMVLKQPKQKEISK